MSTQNELVKLTVREWEALNRILQEQAKEIRRLADSELVRQAKLSSYSIVWGLFGAAVWSAFSQAVARYFLK